MLALEPYDEQPPLLRDSSATRWLYAHPSSRQPRADLSIDNAPFTRSAGRGDDLPTPARDRCHDPAITNDWCSVADQRLDGPRPGLFGAYAAIAAFTCCRGRARPASAGASPGSRFWLSRHDRRPPFQSAARCAIGHDPGEFQRRLAQRQQVGLALPSAPLRPGWRLYSQRSAAGWASGRSFGRTGPGVDRYSPAAPAALYSAERR